MTSQDCLFHCPCLSPFNPLQPPASSPPLSLFQHDQLSNLLFCEECDQIRCQRCTLIEVACYYCPNCLFEVPTASIRGEKNRCARNCFQCPHCIHTLSVVASDPTPPPTSSSENSTPQTTSAIGEPPYSLNCTVCGWNSKLCGIEFEKPTGLALQLQKMDKDSSTIELNEFDHIKDHLEPFVRKSQNQVNRQTSTTTTTTASTSNPAITNSKGMTNNLFKDVPGFNTRFSSSSGSLYGKGRGGTTGGAGIDQGSSRDELEVYRSISTSSAHQGSEGRGKDQKGKGKTIGDMDKVLGMRRMNDLEQVASLEKRWNVGWNQPLFSKDLLPLRTPLQSKRSKRCPTCKHILIKPEQKSSSTRYKIKLVAANYLPSISVWRRPTTSIGSRLSAIAAGNSTRRSGSRSNDAGGGGGQGMEELEPMRPGRTYTFELSFSNPLYEPIQVRLAVARPITSNNKNKNDSNQDQTTTTTTPPFAVHLPSTTFPVSAYAEDWEYEDDEDQYYSREERSQGGSIDEESSTTGEGGEGGGLGGEGGLSSSSPRKKRRSGPGILERRRNRTTVQMDVAIARDVVGSLRANMLVTYVYQSDDPVSTATTAGGEGTNLLPPSPTKSSTKGGGASNVKSFSFWTLLPLGIVQPRTSTTTTVGTESRRSTMVG